MKPRANQWTQEEDETVDQCLAAGMSWREISLLLGRTVAACQQRQTIRPKPKTKPKQDLYSVWVTAMQAIRRNNETAKMLKPIAPDPDKC